MPAQEYYKLVKQFAKSWTGDLALSSIDIDRQNFSSHPLVNEINALIIGESASLPFITKNGARWVTVSPDIESLEIAIEDLRAWILPSVGWEDEESSIVRPADAHIKIRDLISVISPSGYFRWQTNKKQISKIIEKLQAMRKLSEQRPEHTYLHVPSLFELRQLFEVALLIKDKVEAQKAIESIDDNKLDTAYNTGFMEIRLLAEFREFEKIVNHPKLNELLNLRMPHDIRLDFVRAFYLHFLQDLENQNDIVGARNSFQDNVAPLLNSLLSLCNPNDNLETRRLLGYKALLYKDDVLAAEILKYTSDTFLQNLLKPFRSSNFIAKPSKTELFQKAHQKLDWRLMQEIGIKILFEKENQTEELPLDYLTNLLRFSLQYRANQKLQEKLSSFRLDSEQMVVPQTWLEFADRLGKKDWKSGSEFLALENRPILENVNLNSASSFLETLQELFTDPDLESDSVGKEILQSALTALIREFLTAPNFPDKSLISIYRQLLELWAIYKNGSSHPADANLLLTLAEPVLQNDSNSEKNVTEILVNWWQTRKVRALLPFLLNSLEILTENNTNLEICKNLWIEGADFVRLNLESISPTEINLWRFVGANLGLENDLINEFLTIEKTVEPIDLLAKLENIKIAIVSLQIESARTAAELIQQRTNGEVIVVSETHNNASVEKAKNSDVILFVWASNTHAVYRAFDNSREKLVYVQGKGTSSIVISIEKWVIQN